MYFKIPLRLVLRESRSALSEQSALDDAPEVPASIVLRLEQIDRVSISADMEETRQAAARDARSLFRL
jgi:hypothetical protein